MPCWDGFYCWGAGWGRGEALRRKEKRLKVCCSSHENVLVHLIYVGLELGIACSGTAQSMQVSVSLWNSKMCSKDAFPWPFSGSWAQLCRQCCFLRGHRTTKPCEFTSFCFPILFSNHWFLIFLHATCVFKPQQLEVFLSTSVMWISLPTAHTQHRAKAFKMPSSFI